jgi:hypothetical protein
MARDIIHQNVKNALIKDGWTITQDPYRLKFEEFNLAVDLSAERQITAERGGDKIMVEIKSFSGQSFVKDLQQAMGQYLMYVAFLQETAPEYQVYIGLSQDAYDRFFQQKAVLFLQKRYGLELLIVDIEQEEVVTWIK